MRIFNQQKSKPRSRRQWLHFGKLLETVSPTLCCLFGAVESFFKYVVTCKLCPRYKNEFLHTTHSYPTELSSNPHIQTSMQVRGQAQSCQGGHMKDTSIRLHTKGALARDRVNLRLHTKEALARDQANVLFYKGALGASSSWKFLKVIFVPKCLMIYNKLKTTNLYILVLYIIYIYIYIYMHTLLLAKTPTIISIIFHFCTKMSFVI